MKVIAIIWLGALAALMAITPGWAQCFGRNGYEQGQCVEYR
jgi:hypothetical protein